MHPPRASETGLSRCQRTSTFRAAPCTIPQQACPALRRLATPKCFIHVSSEQLLVAAPRLCANAQCLACSCIRLPLRAPLM